MSIDVFIERDPDALRDEAAAEEVKRQTVTVELSLPLAWLLRDLIGLQGLSHRLPIDLQSDMQRLNKVLGNRVDAGPHVSRWAARWASRLMQR